MKKIYLLTSLILPLMAAAQPTVTQSDLPVAGLAFIMGTDTGYSAAITPGGANQSWNYSTLADVRDDTSGFISSAGTPYLSTFPTSNLAANNPLNNTWYYYTSDSSGFYVNGIAGPGSPTGGVVIISPAQLYAPVPFTYNDTRNNISRVVVDTVYSGFNAQFVLNFNETFLADGFGTLTTPTGFYSSVLRIKITTLQIDSAYWDPFSTGTYSPVPSAFFSPIIHQSTFYRWVQDQQPAYVLGIGADSLGTTANYSEYLTSYVILSNQDHAAQQHTMLVYPNPANENICFRNTSNGEAILSIRNFLGQEMENRMIGHDKPVSVDVSKYANGIYSYSVVTGREKKSGTFSVQH
ncbi:MAG: T9SS type A sorting domain-containing protein [Bacteroidetes bacterium]|nr:T9SS type A sorting domain-containing protein [Bacteroidota bacterium]